MAVNPFDPIFLDLTCRWVYVETNRFTTAWGGSRFKKKSLIKHAVFVDVLYHSAGYFPMMVTNFL